MNLQSQGGLFGYLCSAMVSSLLISDFDLYALELEVIAYSLYVIFCHF